MISRSQIIELRDEWKTTELNVAREYVQHVLISSLFRNLHKQIKLAFKGGTALRIIWRSPRFSEDLDFTAWGTAYHVQGSLNDTMAEVEKAGLNIKLVESNKTSGGWFALAKTQVHEWSINIEWNISLRQVDQKSIVPTLITTPLWASYSLLALSAEQMAYEKVEALFRRRKPRDFFDIYFLLRNRLGVSEILKRKSQLIAEIKRLNANTVGRELRLFMPQNQWPVAKQLPKLLAMELNR
jgi:predicted nucleotidyltransferase component of viral defense system